MTSQLSIYAGIFILIFLLSACSLTTMTASPTSTSALTLLPSRPDATLPISTAPASSTPSPEEPSASLAATKVTPSITNTTTQSSVQSLPNPENFTWQIFAEGLHQPVGLVAPIDGSRRLFVLEQTGVIRIIKDGELLPDPFLDLQERVSTTGSTTAGLLGLAFHPKYAINGYFYLHYTDSRGISVISRYLTSHDTNFGDPDSELRLLEISFPVGEHKGGDLNFGPDGYLYISVGDGGAGGYGDQEGNAQNPDTLLGSILRIDVDSEAPYAIPEDNPFSSGGGLPEVWAYGLRNPWRFTFDHLTGEMYISDVGENRWEEINYLPAGTVGGANFGWSYLEGNAVYKSQPPASLNPVYPVVQYDHTHGCSVTGGEVYRGNALPEWYGVYVYGDFCQGNIWGLLKRGDGMWENELMFKIPGFITSFGLDEDGEIYLVDLTGKIFMLVRKSTG